MNDLKDHVPFMHFMALRVVGRKYELVSPAEDHDTVGGRFVVPTLYRRRFYPKYRFHFSFYRGLGEHEFDPDTFVGEAVSTMKDHKVCLSLVFPSMCRVRLSNARSGILPIRYRRVGEMPKVPYGGKMIHPDFDKKFLIMESIEPDVENILLDECGISIRGCDSHTQYVRPK